MHYAVFCFVFDALLLNTFLYILRTQASAQYTPIILYYNNIIHNKYNISIHVDRHGYSDHSWFIRCI